MAIDNSTWSLVLQMREQLTRIQDAHTRALTASWARAWEDVQSDLVGAMNELLVQAGEDRVTRSAVMKSQRLANALGVIERQLNDLFEQSGQTAISKLRDVVDNAGRTQEALIAKQLPKSERAIVNGWSRVDKDQVAAIVQRSTEQITKLSYPLADEATARMRRELVRGLISGSNPRTVAADMLKRTQRTFNGGLSRALTIARTEQLDAHRAAAKVSEEANADVLQCWIWVASLSARTCPACWGMNGQEFPLDQSGPDGHQNCRCVRVPKTKSWRDLGFDIDEPPSLIPDAGNVFEALPPAEQAKILGPVRYNAYRAGNFPIDAWAQKQSNPGWRDSWVPANPPSGGSGRNKLPRSSRPPAAGTGQGGGGKSPKAPSSSGSFPPIGTVLQAKGGNRYNLPGSNARPRPHGHNPDWEYEFIANATHRMTAMLQYYFESERLVKHVARNVRAGTDPIDGLTNLAAFRVRKSGLLPGYTVDDLKLDAIAAGTRLAKMKDVSLGTVYRGIAVDADAADLLRRYQPGHTEDWSLSSSTNDRTYAENHAHGMRQNQAGRTVVLWNIAGAKGQILRPVGRMASIDERLVNGRVKVLKAVEHPDGVVEVFAKWLQS